MPDPTLEIKDSRYSLDLWCGGGVVFRGGYLDLLYEQLDRWHAALPLASLVWEKTGTEGDNLLYRLVAAAADGRVWTISVVVQPASEALFSFSVPGRFAEPEFEPQRELRRTLIRLAGQNVMKLEVTWA